MKSNEDYYKANRVDTLLASKFFKARTQAKLGVSETAVRLCVSQRHYCEVERGERRITPTMVTKMSALTRLPIKWFFNAHGGNESTRSPKQRAEFRARWQTPKSMPPARIEALLKRLPDV